MEEAKDFYRERLSPQREKIVQKRISAFEKTALGNNTPEKEPSPDTRAPDRSQETARNGQLPALLPEMDRNIDMLNLPVTSINPVGTITRPVDQQTTAEPVQTEDKPAVTIDQTFTAVISFGFNTNEISPSAREELDHLASAMATDQDLEIVVTGYTDALGSQHFNKKLSEFRALVVKSYLVGKGIDPERIETMGLAEKDPIESNETVIGRTANRRVEIRVKGN
jgi:outer membrane protein OmpA-like peptidoglycan-associated protein